jgi:Fur family transcriptional regulator, ferric uptake regulator
MPGLETALTKLRDAGFKITNARLAVLNTLYQSGNHLTSADVIERIEADDTSIGRASIFRTLELLTSLAIIRPTYVNSNTPTYVLLSKEGHHSHIICTNCDRVIELDECHVDKMMDQIEQDHHIHLTGHLVEFYGICDTCLPQQR